MFFLISLSLTLEVRLRDDEVMTRPAARYPLDYPLTLLRPEADGSDIAEVIPASSFNLSRSGIGVRLQKACDFKIDEEIKVSLHYGESPDEREGILIEAKVIWQNDDFCGLKITRIQERSRHLYDQLLAGFETLIDESKDTFEPDSNSEAA